MAKKITKRDLIIPLMFVAALVLDRFLPHAEHVDGAWILPAIMGLSALVGAVKNKRESKNTNAADTYKAERQNAIDTYEANLSKAKRGERVRYANAIAKMRGFAVPALDTSASEGVGLNLPSVPKLKDGSWIDVLGGALGGLGEGITTEARLNAARDSLPGSTSSFGDSGDGSALGVTSYDPAVQANPTGITSITRTPAGELANPDFSGVASSNVGGNLSAGPDPISAFLSRRQYWSNLSPYRGGR